MNDFGIRVQADELSDLRGISEPILRFADWYEQEILGKSLNDVAREGAPTYLFFDEVQNLKDWAPQLKSLLDHSTTQAVVTGSSALRIEMGRDSLAGRVSTIEAGVLSLTEIAAFRGIGLGPPFLPDNGLEPLTRRELWLDLREHGRSALITQTIASSEVAEHTAPYLSTIADAILVMDYDTEGYELDRTMRVIKMRGSDHEQHPYRLMIGAGGVSVQKLTPEEARKAEDLRWRRRTDRL